MDIVEIIKAAGLLLGGSGIHWLFAFRLRKKRMRTEVNKEEFEAMDQMVDQFIARLKELSEDVTVTIAENTELHKQLNRLVKENDRLKELQKKNQ